MFKLDVTLKFIAAFTIMLSAAQLILSFKELYMFFSSEVKVIDIIKNEHCKMWIYDTSKERCLSFKDPRLGRLSRQSCIMLADVDKIVFDYQKSILSALYINTGPKKVLMIGLGGGTLAKAILALLPDVTLDIVEINRDMPYVAKQYFFFNATEKTNIVIMDGAEFIRYKAQQYNKQGYDFIIMDAFDQDYIPDHFLKKEFVMQLKEIMRDGGILAVNTFTSSKHYERETELYHAIFGKFWSLSTQNRVILATKEPLLNMDIISMNAKLWREKFSSLDIDSDLLLKKFTIE
ncbi:MAG: spermidine synthase [Candidatus Lariskella arthropodorum]